MTDIRGLSLALVDAAADSMALGIRLEGVKRRIEELAEFERRFFGTDASPDLAMDDSASTDGEPDKKKLYKAQDGVGDLCTHFEWHCKSRKQLDRDAYAWMYGRKCTLCFAPFSTMDIKYWEPVRHKKTMRKLKAIARKERENTRQVRLSLAAIAGDRHPGTFSRDADIEYEASESSVHTISTPASTPPTRYSQSRSRSQTPSPIHTSTPYPVRTESLPISPLFTQTGRIYRRILNLDSSSDEKLDPNDDMDFEMDVEGMSEDHFDDDADSE